MRRTFVISFLILIFLLVTSSGFSQGISRSKGLGFRMSFWNITGKPTKISVLNETGQAQVDISGAGAGFYFFSRAYNNWFFELCLSAIGGTQTEVKGVVSSDVEVETIVPLLLGLRYDIFANRFQGSLHPYLAGGGGPYWATSIEAENRFGDIISQETVQSSLDYGYYLGGGLNWVLTSWFAINLDIKRHFIEFEHGKDYSGTQFGLGFSLMWGRKQEVFEIKDVKLTVEEIYPAYYQFYNNYPIAFVTVKNLIGYPIDVNVRCNIKSYSERAKDSGFIRVGKGETKDIPVTVFFAKRMLELSKRRTAIMDLKIQARASSTHTKEFSAELTLHSRNAWNGESDKLGFYLTPENEDILSLSRDIIEQMPEEEKTTAGNFNMAKYIFEELSDRKISYRPDPNIPFYQDDRVQFAKETLDIETGDCDDLVVLYASLLESVGIKTAFVDVRDPDKDIAHLYLLFNSGLSANEGHLISTNEKRYIIRATGSGQNTVWIPVETTLVEHGFEEAWKAGALSYLQEGMLRNGLTDGWIKIIDGN